jgi:hypothetical protein
MYVLFDEPEWLVNFAPLLAPTARNFRMVVGHTFFGDLFLRSHDTREYAILIVSTLELAETGEVEEVGF